MNTILNTKEQIIESIKNQKGDINHETRMIMYRFLSEIEYVIEEKGLKRKDIAKMIGTSPSYITQLYRGTKILNLETIAKFQQALDAKFKIELLENNKLILGNSDSFYKLTITSFGDSEAVDVAADCISEAA